MRYLILAACLLNAFFLRSQEKIWNDSSKVSWLKAHAITVADVSPDNKNFSDLAPLKTVLKDVRIVMLGEAAHGEGNVISAKIRLIEFLHEQMDFDMLVFESGFY